MKTEFKNFFDISIPAPVNIKEDEFKKVREFIAYRLSPFLQKVGLNQYQFNDLLCKFDGRSIAELEIYLNNKFNQRDKDLFKDNTLKRSELIFKQLKYILAKYSINLNKLSFLDYGCGNGMISKLVKEAYPNCKILQCDVVNMTQNPSLQFEKIDYEITNKLIKYDVGFLSVVLHHIENPISGLKDLNKYLANKATLIILESCVDLDINHYDRYEKIYSLSYIDDPSNESIIKEYMTFNIIEQRFYTAFIDFFYNRIISNPPVNVPYNFASPDIWIELIQKHLNTVHKESFILGFDHELALQFHTLHVFKK